MDRNLENIRLETSMERFLMAKLRDAEQTNLGLKELVAKGVEISPNDIPRLLEIEKVAERLVREAHSPQTLQYAVSELSYYVKRNGE